MIVALPARLAAKISGSIGRQQLDAAMTLTKPATLANVVRPLRDWSATISGGAPSSFLPERFAQRGANHVFGRKATRIASAGKAGFFAVA